MRTFMLATCLALGAVPSLCAQRIATSPFPSISNGPAMGDARAPGRRGVDQEQRSDRVGTGWLIGGGLLAGATGGVAVMYTGAMLTANDCEDCAIVGAVYGLVAGVSSGIPLGVHFSNGGRGKLLPSLLASLAIGGAGFGLAMAADEPAVMLAVPVLQLASAIGIERSTGREGY
jgi:hypothetical protein